MVSTRTEPTLAKQRIAQRVVEPDAASNTRLPVASSEPTAIGGEHIRVSIEGAGIDKRAPINQFTSTAG